MKVKVLTDSNQSVKNMRKRNCSSFYIETGGRRILFDLGSNSSFATNGKKLSVDISKVDTVVLSSGFADAGGGLKTFVELNNAAKIYIQEKAFLSHYTTKMGIRFSCGLDPYLQENANIIRANYLSFVDESIQLISNVVGLKYCLKENLKYYVKEDGEYKEDKFEHELYMLVQEENKNILFLGNTNRGVANIIHKIESITNMKVDYIFAGFGYLEEGLKFDENAQQINEMMKELKSENRHFYISSLHGKEVCGELENSLKNEITYFSQGEEITI